MHMYIYMGYAHLEYKPFFKYILFTLPHVFILLL